MKSTGYIFILIVFLATFSFHAQSQIFTTTQVGVNIVEGLSIASTSSMNFGSLPVPQSPVQVVLSTTDSRLRVSAEDYSFIPDETIAENAAFTVGGYKGATYSITFPQQGSVRISNGQATTEVVDFIAHPASTGSDTMSGMLNAQGTDRFTVGATVKLASGQSAGNYTGTFGISVNYN